MHAPQWTARTPDTRSAGARTLARTAVAVAALGLTATACGASGGASDGQITLQHALWNDNAVAGEQKCADAFHQEHPNITVKITQTAWTQYWQNLTTQVVSGTAPDTFTDSVLYYPKFMKNGQMLDITQYVNRDKIDLSQYQPTLADIWVNEGKRYGLPVDWDTIAVAVNTETLQKAGFTATQMANWTWNPTDGGDFGKAIAATTVDVNGRNGLDPAFDKDHVKTYGLALDYEGGAHGQDSWGNFAVSNGFTYTDKNPFGSQYNYSDPRLAATIDWFAGLIKKGFIPRYDKQSASTIGGDALMKADKAAMSVTGSWMAKTYLSGSSKIAFVPLPIGPTGRKSAINGLSDAIYAGTKHPDQAWEWVKFLASSKCQDIIAQQGVAFPSIKTATEAAQTTATSQGRDMHVFVDEAKAPNGTFLLPITDHGDQVGEIVQNAIDRVWLGEVDAKTALTGAADAVSKVMKS